MAAIADYLRHHNANTHWRYPTSDETDAILARRAPALADFLNAGADEIAFGANMTTLTFHLARALGRALVDRATRSSSPSSTTTPTSIPGARWRGIAGSCVRVVADRTRRRRSSTGIDFAAQ